MSRTDPRGGLGPGDLQPAVKYEDPGGPKDVKSASGKIVAPPAPQILRKLNGFTDKLPGTKITPILRFYGVQGTYTNGRVTSLLSYTVPTSRYLVVTWLSFHLLVTDPLVAVNDSWIELGGPSTSALAYSWFMRWELEAQGSLTSPGQVHTVVYDGAMAVLYQHGAFYATGINVFDHFGWHAMNPGFVISPGGSIKTRSVQLAAVAGQSPDYTGCNMGGFLCPEDVVFKFLKSADGVPE